MTKQTHTTPPKTLSFFHMPAIALLAWAVPGAGHLALGQRVRGTVLLITIALTFWTGVAVGGVKNTVNPRDRTWWFMAQVCAGAHPFLAIAWGSRIELPEDGDPTEYIAYGQSEEISIVYTGIAGMLNVLVILDALGRAEKIMLTRPRRPTKREAKL
jgi:hypothetical protein